MKLPAVRRRQSVLHSVAAAGSKLTILALCSFWLSDSSRLKVVFIQKEFMCLSFLHTDKQNHFPELGFRFFFSYNIAQFMSKKKLKLLGIRAASSPYLTCFEPFIM